MSIKNCLNCNNEFTIATTYLQFSRGKFCSKECYWKNKKGKPTGKVTFRGAGKKNPAWNGQDDIVSNCPICGIEFSFRPYQKQKYCSYQCYWETLEGKIVRPKPKNIIWGHNLKHVMKGGVQNS